MMRRDPGRLGGTLHDLLVVGGGIHGACVAWDATLRGDYYHQTKTFARIYNSTADRIKAWDNVNLTFTVNNEDLGVEVGAFVKNATDETAITDFYLTDDSSGLFRNVFYTEPRTYGIWVSKSF